VEIVTLPVAAFLLAGPVIIGLADTLERPWGARIAARGTKRNPVRSSHSPFFKTSGWRWLLFMSTGANPIG
jgi:hypothetical protein